MNDWMLDGGGEMGRLVRNHDWAATPLGPMTSWPRSLKTTVATILHSRHPMFLWWGPELVQFYNDAYMPSFGMGKHPTALGQRGRECWPEIWHIIGSQIDDVMLRGTPSWHQDALVPIFRNGAIEEVYWTYGYSPVFDDDGSIGGTLVVCTETTGRVVATQREAALRAEVERDRSRMRQFFAQAPAGICILTGRELTFEYANDHYRALVGGRDVAGKPLLEALPELVGQGFETLLHGVMDSGEPFVGRERPVRIDRQGQGVADEAFYTFIYSPLRDAQARIEAVVVLALDVTDEVLTKRQTEQLARRLRESDAQFHLLAETIPQLAWSARADGDVDWYNQRWYDYTGTTFEDMKAEGRTAVLDPERLDEVLAQWQASVVAGEQFEMEFAIRGRDGQFRWHLTRAVPLRDESGHIVRWFGTNTDIDASRRAEIERVALLENEQRARLAAELASRAKDEFLTTASHELRTPLNAILGWAHMLQSGRLEPGAVRRAVDSIERNARIQVRLVEDILDGSRIVTGQLQMTSRDVDLIAVVNAALDSVRDAAAAKRIALAIDLEPATAQVSGDPERLQQVVWNLTMNAIKFTRNGGNVHVALRNSGTEVQLQVTDNGEGISAEFLPHVFERFRQAEGSTARRYEGLGLGLALVRHIVEAHGGTVRAESDGPGLGATFIVTLPVQVAAGKGQVDRPVHGAEPVLVGDVDLRGVSVLVVDDQADGRDLVATVLRSQGADVTAVGTAKEALALMTTRTFDVMVSDIGMPITDGYGLIGQTRALDAARGTYLPAVALTAYSREEDRRLALDAGFQAYVAKPVEPEELLRVLAGLVMTSK